MVVIIINNIRMQQLRGTNEALTTKNITPNAGEFIYNTTNNTLKVGDGIKSYNDLPSLLGLDLPPNDNNIYVIKNKKFVSLDGNELNIKINKEINETGEICLEFFFPFFYANKVTTNAIYDLLNYKWTFPFKIGTLKAIEIRADIPCDTKFDARINGRSVLNEMINITDKWSRYETVYQYINKDEELLFIITPSSSAKHLQVKVFIDVGNYLYNFYTNYIPSKNTLFTNHPGIDGVATLDSLFKYIDIPEISLLKRLHEHSLILYGKENDDIYAIGTNLAIQYKIAGTDTLMMDGKSYITGNNTYHLYNNPRKLCQEELNEDAEYKIKDIGVCLASNGNKMYYAFLKEYNRVYYGYNSNSTSIPMRYINYLSVSDDINIKFQKSNISSKTSNSTYLFLLYDRLHNHYINGGSGTTSQIIAETGQMAADLSSGAYTHATIRVFLDDTEGNREYKLIKKIEYPLFLDIDGNVYNYSDGKFTAGNSVFYIDKKATSNNIINVGKVIDCWVSDSTDFKFLLNENYELYALGNNAKYNLALPLAQTYNVYTYVGTYNKLKKLILTDDVTIMLMNDGSLYITGTPKTISSNVRTSNGLSISYKLVDISLLPGTLNKVYQGFTRILESYYISDIEIYFNSLIFIGEYKG